VTKILMSVHIELIQQLSDPRWTESGLTKRNLRMHDETKNVTEPASLVAFRS
jgi:hypothetical protein